MDVFIHLHLDKGEKARMVRIDVIISLDDGHFFFDIGESNAEEWV